MAASFPEAKSSDVPSLGLFSATPRLCFPIMRSRGCAYVHIYIYVCACVCIHAYVLMLGVGACNVLYIYIYIYTRVSAHIGCQFGLCNVFFLVLVLHFKLYVE